MPNEIGRKFTGTIATVKTLKSSGGSAGWTPTSLANGSARETAKIDLGATQPAAGWTVALETKGVSAPTANLTSDVYWNASDSATAGTDNRGDAAGVDQAYPASGTLAEKLRQLTYIGSLVHSSTTTAQKQDVGVLVPTSRYGSFVVRNASGVAYSGTATDHILTLTPRIDESQ
jgi:hypothetical protein